MPVIVNNGKIFALCLILVPKLDDPKEKAKTKTNIILNIIPTYRCLRNIFFLSDRKIRTK